MKESAFKINQEGVLSIDGKRYKVIDRVDPNGGPGERTYTILLLGRWLLYPPAITHTFSEAFLIQHFTAK